MLEESKLDMARTKAEKLGHELTDFRDGHLIHGMNAPLASVAYCKKCRRVAAVSEASGMDGNALVFECIPGNVKVPLGLVETVQDILDLVVGDDTHFISEVRENAHACLTQLKEAMAEGVTT